mmetsp:Transcript_17704/g.26216  ORF Transcript_17704/g.26216 Transcript_17704/m.26216 type:complete len:158 (-) Transcript_17704:255-728(-)
MDDFVIVDEDHTNKTLATTGTKDPLAFVDKNIEDDQQPASIFQSLATAVTQLQAWDEKHRVTENASKTIHTTADKVKEWNEKNRILERTNESIQSAGEAMKKWDEERKLAEKFNTTMEVTGKQVQAWDEKKQVRVKATKMASERFAQLSKKCEQNAA